MSKFSFKGLKITGISSAVPTNIVLPEDYIDVFGEERIEKFKEMTGVKEYRKAGEKQTASDLGYAAANNLLDKIGVDRSDIGAIIFCAHSTDYRRPATACVLHKRLGLKKNCLAFDLALGCSAFVYGLQVICSIMSCSDVKKALLISAETMTKIVSPRDSSSVMLFGDAGSAALIEKTNEDDVIEGELKSDGEGYKAIIAPAGGFRNLNASKEFIMWDDGNERTLYNTVMNGVDVFSFTVTEVPRTIKSFLKESGTTIETYDVVALHQANKYILEQLSKKLKIPEEKLPIAIDRFGNTSAPAIPLLLSDKYGQKSGGSIKVLMSGFGVGLSWGVASAEIDVDRIFPIIETDDYFEEGIINGPDDM